MAFDVYVGTMTRFYRREWENVVQRMSREQGFEYTMIHAGGSLASGEPARQNPRYRPARNARRGRRPSVVSTTGITESFRGDSW